MSGRVRVDRRDPQSEERFRIAYEMAKSRSRALEGPSPAERLARLPPALRAIILAALTILDRVRLLHMWSFWARPKQMAPDEPHRVWAYLAGRGSGKSRAGAERIRQRVYAGAMAIAIVGPTLRDIARYQIGGRDPLRGSGLLDVFPKHQRPSWNKQAGEITFHTGAVAYIVTAEEAEYRGGNIDTAWCDEVCKWEPRRRQALWDNIEFSLRSDCGIPVEIIVTSTPNPHRFIKDLVADPDCITYLGNSDENASNLEKGYIARIRRKFGDSRKGRQERGGEILTEVEGALFSQALIDAHRRGATKLVRVVVAIDPAISGKRRSDDTAITVVGIDAEGELYVLDFEADKFKPEEWAAAALDLYRKWSCHAIVAERNRGGDLVKSNVQLVHRERCRAEGKVYTPIPFVETQASKSKESRAEELSTLHEQGRLHFPLTPIPALEDEITEWDPLAGGPSPNGLDSLVWGAWHLCDGFGDAPPPPQDAAGVVRLNEQLRRPGSPKRRDLW
jgi:predicted phage terminase large subunit-like protein